MSLHVAKTNDETFQSTPPVKAATEAAISRRANLIFQSTPPVKAATPPRR